MQLTQLDLTSHLFSRPKRPLSRTLFSKANKIINHALKTHQVMISKFGSINYHDVFDFMCNTYPRDTIEEIMDKLLKDYWISRVSYYY